MVRNKRLPSDKLGRNVVFFVIVPNIFQLYIVIMKKLISQKHQARRITMVAYNGIEILDVTGPLEVFAIANELHKEAGGRFPLYQTEIAAEHQDTVLHSSSNIRFLTDTAFASCRQTDTLLVAGGPTAEEAPEALLVWIRDIAPRCRRIASICTGAFVLARAGLLAERRATTHWLWADRLRQCFPSVRVEADAIYVKDGSIYTSAGVTAGIDLALALVEEDCGRDMALNIARLLVLYFKRPGGQSQFSTSLLSQYRQDGSLAPIVQWIRDNYRREIDNEMLAHQVAMSLRNFARVFKKETGLSPARFVEKVRIEAAVKLLEETTLPLKTIARECGFQSGEHFRLTFARRFKITPGVYRARFQPDREQTQTKEY